MKTFENFNIEDLKNLRGSGKNINISYDMYDNDQDKPFWGNVGAGVLPISTSGKILVALRSEYVNEPNTWGVWGGKLDDAEDIQQTCKREFIEETNYLHSIELIPAYVFKTEGFEYHNFIGIVEQEFEPTLNWETQDFKWCSFDKLQDLEPKHFGLENLLKDPKSLKLIKQYSV
jgi:8-oxo-dGTP pyrophosphatase MutT (NUDIX family)